MGQEYFIYNEREQKTQRVSKDQYEFAHDVNYRSAQNSPEEKSRQQRIILVASGQEQM